ncbi:Nuclear cap-binding protein subunit 1 [Nymphon striatum]|nr:Nuclear cap-binding protein subunit 1 [Nymphon striatum]
MVQKMLQQNSTSYVCIYACNSKSIFIILMKIWGAAAGQIDTARSQVTRKPDPVKYPLPLKYAILPCPPPVPAKQEGATACTQYFKASRTTCQHENRPRVTMTYSRFTIYINSCSRKRRRVTSEPAEVEDRLESLVAHLGEKIGSSVESNIESLASIIESDIQNYKVKILGILMKYARTAPDKRELYTCLVGVINARNYSFGGEFVEQIVRAFKDDLKACKFEDARILLRFISDLVNCHVVSVQSLLNLFESLFEVTNEEDVVKVRADWYVYVVLSSLPWIGRELSDKKEQDFERLLNSIDSFIRGRTKLHHSFLRIWSSDTPHPQEEYLDCLWAQIMKLKSDKWEEKYIHRPYIAFDALLSEALQHDLPQIIPPPHNEDSTYPYPSVIFRLFDYTDCPEGPILPGAHSIERFLIEEQLGLIIQQSHLERKGCAGNLLSYGKKQNIPLEYMIVEVMFSELFHLPTSKYLEVCIGSLLLELCRLQPSSMPQVLAQTTELLFERLDTMNITCIDRFSNWFSYHLSNFQLRYTWDDWAACLELDQEHPKPKFIKEMLLRCLRLSYHQRIVDVMPSQYSTLIPVKPLPIYKYEAEGGSSLPGAPEAQQILQLIKSKCTPDEIIYKLKDLTTSLPDDAEISLTQLKTDVFVQTLLFVACKSFSHSFAAIAKFYPVFKELGSTEENQICILKSLFYVWKNHQQMMIVLIDKFLKTQVIECSAVANWIFSPDMTSEFTKGYIWDILHLTIRKMSKYVLKLQKELAVSREKLDKLREVSDSEDENDDAPTEREVEIMEEKLEVAQSDQKNVFLIVFQRFIMILSEHMVKCDTEGRNFETFWYKWTIGRLQEVFMLHDEQVQKYVPTLSTLLFSHDTDYHILGIFNQYCSLRS